MNLEKWNQLQKLVLKLVKSGDAELNETDFKQVKSLCKKGLVSMPDTFGLIMKHLHTNHCQVRVSAFQILDGLFQRSHAIRELTLEKLKTIVSLTLALELSDELPPPRKFHQVLKKCAIKAIDTWHEKFGAHYNKLKISYNFLRSKKNVDFKKLIARSDFEQKQQEKLLQEEKKVAEYIVTKTISNFEEQLDSFKDCIFEASTCFHLLSPEGSKLVDTGTRTEQGNAIESIRSHVMPKNFTMSIIVDHAQKIEVQETPDNSSIIQTLDDRIRQAEKSFIPKLDNWIEQLIKNDGEQKDVLPLIKTKEKLNIICRKYATLEITRTSKRKRRIVQKEVGDSDDSDFDEVDESTVMDQIPEEKKLKLSMDIYKWKTKNKSLVAKTKQLAPSVQKYIADDELPCSSSSILESKEVNNCSDKLQQEPNKMKAVLKSDIENDDIESDVALHSYALMRFESLHRFWSPKDIDPEEIDVNTVHALNPKYCNVPGKFEPVVWSCRAPMKPGKLCPRMDRFKCPLHGKVVPRDREGKPNGKTADLFKKSEMLSTSNSNGESWKEVEQEIEKLTGEKLNYSKIKKKREVKPTNLVSIAKNAPNTPRTRIEKKILSRKAIKAVNESTDKVESTRNKGAFDQQFNYAMN